ncbi:MAG TPA: oligoendopeptidase F [Holosporales bacterium]|nr:oligoendopeptidase F [Holosporales bacterium]
MTDAQLPKWDLTDLYKNIHDAKIQSDQDYLCQICASFSRKYKTLFSGSAWCADDLFDALSSYEEITSLSTKLAVYARLLSFTNLDKEDIQRFYQKIVEFLTTLEQQLAFFTIDLNSIHQDQFDKAFLEYKDLLFYKPWLRRVRAMKDYQLDEKLEQLLSDKSITSTQVWSKLFDETLSKLRFDYNGEKIGIAEISNLQSNSDQNIREAAAKSIAKTLKAQGDLFVTITNVLAKDLEINNRWRGFKDVAAARHLSNDVEEDVVNSLFTTVQNNYASLAHRFYKLKSQLMGVEKLAYWDRNAPLPFVDDSKIYSWNEAKDIVLNAYGSFSEQARSLVNQFFANKWIDAPAAASKYSGAFNMPTFKGHHPYILLNFKGKLRDVSTLAHELGHGMHSLLADEKGTLMANAPLTLCETASVFGEMLTFQSLLKQSKSPQQRVQALEAKISDMINTVVRQIAFYDFERRVHESRRQNGELSREEINKHWLETQKQALGPYVDVPDEVQEFWMTIPHFIHSAFYVYAYAFGDCLVNSLYEVYRKQPKNKEGDFETKYMNMLRAGGTKHHKELLAPFGLDASDPDFWQQGMHLVHTFIDDLEAEMMNL